MNEDNADRKHSAAEERLRQSPGRKGVLTDRSDVQPQRRQQVLGDIDGIARTLLSTYYKIGCYNVFDKGFMAVIEYEDSYTKPGEVL